MELEHTTLWRWAHIPRTLGYNPTYQWACKTCNTPHVNALTIDQLIHTHSHNICMVSNPDCDDL